jgi:hypothetical protein
VCLGTKWKDYQIIYYSNRSFKKLGTKWAHLVIQKLWKIAWAMWQNRNNKDDKNKRNKELDFLQQRYKKDGKRDQADTLVYPI